MGKKSKKKKKNKKQQENQQQIRTGRSDELVVNMSTMPQLLRVFVFLGCGLKIVGIVLLTTFILITGMLGCEILFENGIKKFLDFGVDFITFWNLENLFILFMVAGPFVLWYISAKWLKKHYKEIHFKACEDKVMIEQKVGNPILLTYEELGLSIRTRKIKIGPDWIEIPYDTGIRQVSPEWTEGPLTEKKIRLYSFGKEDIGELLAHLSRKCGIPYGKQKTVEIMKSYTAGWIMTYFAGWPVLLISVYIFGLLYVIEEYESIWELIMAVPENHIGVACGGIIAVIWIVTGYVIKLLLLGILRNYFKPYKNFFHISW